MKKKSILLTCIVAIMALAMFVGCDNAPVFPDMPKSVKGGYLTQTGVILTGQEVTADKFTLTVEYDNGDEPTVMPATNIQLDGTGNVFAVAGLDSDNNPVDTEKLLVAFTDANRIEATGFKESYTVSEAKAIKPSDLQVKAYYGTDGVVDLTSSEFVVKTASGVDLDKVVSPSNPTAQVSVIVRSLVGVEGANAAASNVLDESYLITVNYAETETPEFAIEELTSVSFAEGFALKALAYDEVPAPTLDDVVFAGTYDNGEKFEGKKLPADTEIELYYVEYPTALELINKDLIDDTTLYYVNAIYNGEVIGFAGDAVAPTEVEVLIEPVEDYVAPKFKAGDTFTTPASEDFDVVIKVGETYQRLDAAAKENVVLSYGTVDGSDKFTASTAFVDGHYLYVQADYMGAKGHTEDAMTIVGKADPIPAVASITANFKKDIAGLAKQTYNDIDAVLALNPADVLDSITLHMTEDAEDQTIPASSFGSDVAVFWTTSANSYVPVTGDAITAENLYIIVYYKGTFNDYSDAIKTVAAVATDLDVEVTYNNTLNGDKVTPMMGATATLSVKAVNDLGVVAALEASKGFGPTDAGYMVDDGPAANFATSVDEKEHTYTISAFVGEKRLEKQITVPAGTEYVKFTSSATEPTVTLNDEYVALIDSPISAITAEDLVISNLDTANNKSEEYSIEITAIPSTTKTVEETGNVIIAKVEWLAADGSYDEKVVTVTFAGEKWIEPEEFTVTYKDVVYSNAVTNFPAGYGIAVSDFVVTPSSYKNHGSADLPTVTMIEVNDNPEYQYTSGQTFDATGAGITLDITISYDDGMSDTLSTTTLRVTTASV